MSKPPPSTLLRSLLASTVRGWRGTQVLRPAEAPKQLLIVYDRENDPRCRLLRELLTELQLDALIQPCPQGGKRFARKRPRGSQLPYLIDRDQDVRANGLRACMDHVLEHYAHVDRAAGLLGSWPMLVTSKLATALRGSAGLRAQASRAPRKPLELYSFESSPYSRLVREVLCELELPYVLRNTAKARNTDMGPPVVRDRWFKAPKDTSRNRAALLERTGKVQVPYLIDPNTGTEMYESAAIIDYLERTYAT